MRDLSQGAGSNRELSITRLLVNANGSGEVTVLMQIMVILSHTAEFCQDFVIVRSNDQHHPLPRGETWSKPEHQHSDQVALTEPRSLICSKVKAYCILLVKHLTTYPISNRAIRRRLPKETLTSSLPDRGSEIQNTLERLFLPPP